MVLISLIGSIASSKLLTLDASATEKGFDCAVTELNSRECLTWAQTKISASSWVNDDQVFSIIDTDLGVGYSWNTKGANGGTLSFKGRMVLLKRTPSTPDMSGSWRIWWCNKFYDSDRLSTQTPWSDLKQKIKKGFALQNLRCISAPASVVGQEPPITDWPKNARGFLYLSLTILVQILKFYPLFLWPLS